MFPFFGRRRLAANRDVIDRLHQRVVEAARVPAFYLDGGVPDTFFGRLELLILHAALVVRRLRALPEPGPAMGQALVDAVFRNLDPALRELGVGDLAVPKRMKKLAEAFLGRSVAYDAALAGGAPASALPEALSRNVFAGSRPADGMAAYVRAAAADLEAMPLERLVEGSLAFPDPAVFVSH